MPSRFCGQGTVERNLNELMQIGRHIVSITNQPVKVHRQCINGPKSDQNIHQGSLPGSFNVTMNYVANGRRRSRTRVFISWIDLLIYMVKHFGYTDTVKLAYHNEHINGGRPFYFQTYSMGVIQSV